MPLVTDMTMEDRVTILMARVVDLDATVTALRAELDELKDNT